jgi:repressor LexA
MKGRDNMKGLTEKQKRVLEFIESFEEINGMAPTVYEIAENFSVKTSTVFSHLRALQKKKFLTRSSKARSIMVSKPMHPKRRPAGLRSIPLLDLHSINSKTAPLKEIFCDASFLNRASSASDLRNLFAVTMETDELKKKGILNGDVAILRRHPAAIHTGDVILAMIDDHPEFRECTRLDNDSVEISGAHPGSKPRSFLLEDAPFKGVVVSVQRSL